MTTNRQIQKETKKERIKREKQEAIYNDIFKTDYFIVVIDLNKIEDIITTEKNIFIKHKFSCCCYDIQNSSYYNHSKFYHIQGDNMTYKFIIQELIKQDFNKPIDNDIICNHKFFEGIDTIEGNNIQFEPYLSS